MQLFPIENLRTAIIGRAPTATPHLFIETDNAPVPPLSHDPDKLVYRTDLRVSFQQTERPQAEHYVREMAAARITEHLYGNVAQKLVAIRSDLIEEGHPANSPAVVELYTLINVLRGIPQSP